MGAVKLIKIRFTAWRDQRDSVIPCNRILFSFAEIFFELLNSLHQVRQQQHRFRDQRARVAREKWVRRPLARFGLDAIQSRARR